MFVLAIKGLLFVVNISKYPHFRSDFKEEARYQRLFSEPVCQIRKECKLLFTIEELQAKFYQTFSRLSVFGAIDVNLRYVAN